ncbi:MAG: BspA family leucine-rich repeat surface protein [Eubacterium sp.]|nr:BspA family leucine-rich repeat surface protein [Eubacterium sp.]
MMQGSALRVFAEDNTEAFAKYDTGTTALTFFRDTPGKYTNGETSTYSDPEGAEQTITYYTGIETDEYTEDSSVPWSGIRESITTVAFNGKISPRSTANWFRRTTSLVSIDGIENLDTSNVTNMTHMFHNCSVQSLDVSGFNTSNVENMEFAFAYLTNLTELNVSGFNTSAVTNMRWMFGCDYKVKELDVSDFDTSKVTHMGDMFFRCESVESLDVSGFETGNVTNIGWMFGVCKSIKDIDLSGFDTSKVTTMVSLFDECSNLESADISSFEISNANTSNMFHKCDSIARIKLGALTVFPDDPGAEKKEWQRAYDLDCTRIEDLSSYDPAKPGWYEQGYKDVAITGITEKTWTGKAQTQNPVVKLADKTLKNGTDYDITYKNNINVGTSSMTITGKGSYLGTISRTFIINKAVNPLTVKAKKTITVKYSKLKKKARTLAVTKVINFTKDAKDKKSYTLSAAKKG